MSLLRRLLGYRHRRPPGAVFEFWDGAGVRAVDPVAAWYAMDAASGGKWQDWLRLIAAVPPPPPAGVKVNAESTARAAAALRDSQKDASLKLTDAVCVAFGVAPFTPAGGLTLVERIALAAAYLGYMGGLAGAAKAHPPTGSPSATA